MECKVCGRTSQNENANFCDYCGASFRDRGQEVEPNPVEPINQIEPPFYNSEMQKQENQPWMQEKAADVPIEKPISFWIFLGIMTVGLIPGVGLFIQIGILAVFAFGKNKTKVAKNWARAFLVFNFISFFVASYLLMPMLDGLLGSLT